jgi:hypothetical protein
VTVRISQGAQAPRGIEHKGVYFLLRNESLYVGQTTEFATRARGHRASPASLITPPNWSVFITLPEIESSYFAVDSLKATESLLISFWNEICRIKNTDRGADQKPAFLFLQPAILLMEGASAALIWLARNREKLGLGPDFTIPFKNARLKNWPECYFDDPLAKPPEALTAEISADPEQSIPAHTM